MAFDNAQRFAAQIRQDVDPLIQRFNDTLILRSCIQGAPKRGDPNVLSDRTMKLSGPEIHDEPGEAENQTQTGDNALPLGKSPAGVLLLADIGGFVSLDLRLYSMAHAVNDRDIPFAGAIRQKGKTPVLVGSPVLMLDLSPVRRVDFHLGIACGLTVVELSSYDHGLSLCDLMGHPVSENHAGRC